MNPFKKLAKVFTTSKNSSSASSDTVMSSKLDDYSDAQAYLTERMREMEYNEAIRRVNPMTINHAAMNAAQQSMMNSAITTGIGMGAINQAWPSATGASITKSSYPYETNIAQFQVERVDNGYVLRSGSKAKVCKDMDELRDFFVSIMVEHQLDK